MNTVLSPKKCLLIVCLCLSFGIVNRCCADFASLEMTPNENKGDAAETSADFNKLLKKYSGVEVLDYAREVMRPKSFGSVALPPREFTDVVKCGKNIVPYLLPLLKDENKYKRYAAVLSLNEITNKDFGQSELAGNLDTEAIKKINVQWNNWWEVNKRKSRIQWLIEDLRNPDKNTKKWAVIRLGQSGDELAKEPLRNILGDDSVKPFVAESLSKLGDVTVIPKLIEYLKNDDPFVQDTAITRLQRMTGNRFSYQTNLTPELKKVSVGKWENWWSVNKDKYLKEGKQ